MWKAYIARVLFVLAALLATVWLFGTFPVLERTIGPIMDILAIPLLLLMLTCAVLEARKKKHVPPRKHDHANKADV